MKLSLLLAIVLLFLGSACAVRAWSDAVFIRGPIRANVLLFDDSAQSYDRAMVLNSDNPGRQKGFCKAMTPACMGQAAFDKYMEKYRKQYRMYGARSYDGYIRSSKTAASVAHSLSDSSPAMTQKKWRHRGSCLAMKPECMGQEAYDRYMKK